MAQGLSHSEAGGVFPDQRSNPGPENRQVDSYTLSGQGNSSQYFLNKASHVFFLHWAQPVMETVCPISSKTLFLSFFFFNFALPKRHLRHFLSLFCKRSLAISTHSFIWISIMTSLKHGEKQQECQQEGHVR